jgi:hypothetical protein
VSDMPVIGLIFLAYTIASALFKLGLLFWWTHQFHKIYAARYRFSTIFFMMFRPQTKNNMDLEAWKKFEPIQRWNLLSNFMIVGGAFALMFLLLLSKRVGQ